MEISTTEPQWMERLTSLGFNTVLSESPITLVIVGAVAATMSDTLFAEGVFAQRIGFPSVARGPARQHTVVSATHTREDLQYALDTMAKVGRDDYT